MTVEQVCEEILDRGDGVTWRRLRNYSLVVVDELATRKSAGDLEYTALKRIAAARVRSDFLTYQDADGAFADFHANRHTFITNLARAGVPLTTAQTLARHSDPKLTASVYTHLQIHDHAGAIESLPAPPTKGDGLKEPAQLLQATGTDDHNSQPGPVRSLPPACHGSAPAGHSVAQQNTETGGGCQEERGGEVSEEENPQTLKIEGLGTPMHAKSQAKKRRGQDSNRKNATDVIA